MKRFMQCDIYRVSAITALLLFAVSGCGPQAYSFTDSEWYIRPGVSGSTYKRAAILYMGYTSGSSVYQGDMSATDESGDAQTSVSDGNLATDRVLYSNALINALARRGVTVVERNRINELVREQGLLQKELVDLSDIEKIQRLGKLLKVDLLLRGSITSEKGGWDVKVTRLGKAYPYYAAMNGLSLTGIDTRTGEVVWVHTSYMAQRIPPNRVAKQQNGTSTAAMNQMVDAMVEQFWRGGAQ
ncbi:MAG: hypothetical protein JXX29_14495 [Deltaproteobacteria bacterium]|nr:hypothetical protein [Deltaproteobacteria bacterium]MBN2672889.1 hypothetical protein [Deltaproteobacteria bacterium]